MGFVRRISGLTAGLFFLSLNVYAQLCQGSLGDPIVNITFGAGSNPGSSLTAATTAYQYVSNDCPNDGFYTVRNNTGNCFGGTWHSLTADHTGDANGYFMLINASVQPSAFYLDTVRGLCSSTTYEFAAWVMNVLRPFACNANGNQPNLTFSIEKKDGSLLQTYNTNNIPTQGSPNWQQFGFFFTTPPGVSDIVLRIYNNSLGGCGNDLALDDITFRPCGPQIQSAISGYPSATVSYCAGTARSFTFTSTVSAGFNNPSFQWQQSINAGLWTDIPAATTTSFIKNFPSSTIAGIYTYRLSAAEAGNMGSAKCRVASAAMTIDIGAIPVTMIKSNTPLCEGATLLLSVSGNAQYQWTGVNNFSASGTTVSINNAQTSQSGKYYLLATTAAGCIYQDSIMVNINPSPVANITFSATTICEGDKIQLVSSGGTAYQWIPATGLSSTVISGPFASPADTVQYMVIVSNQFACSDTALVLVNVIQRPRADAGPDKTFFVGSNPVLLSGNVSGQNISYSWSPAINITTTQSLQPSVTPPADIDYILTVVSNAGCGIAADTTHVFVYKDVLVPTAFTPNGDGVNDTWHIPALSGLSTFEVSVFNRYGEIVFQTKNANLPWDGKFKGIPQATGVYVYFINLIEQGRILKGTLLILR